MFYFGAAVGAVLGYIAAIFTPGVIAKLRYGYFEKLNQGKGYAQQEAKKL